MNCLPKHPNLTTPTANPPFIIPIKAKSHLKHPTNPSPSSAPPRTPTLPRQISGTKQSHIQKPLILAWQQLGVKRDKSSHPVEGRGGESNPRPKVSVGVPVSRPTRLLESQQTWKEGISHVSPNGYSRYVILGAVTIGFVLFLIGVDDQKALAFGPEGPLMEEFWDNMRRYGLYILTVSTGVAYAILEPIVELLKNPISAILLLVIFGGSFYIVSQVLSAMVGVSEFNYEYGY